MENRPKMNITDYEVLGKLPELLRMESGEAVRSAEDWPRRRRELYRLAVELQYGTLPPEPEFLEVEPLCGGSPRTFRIRTGPKAHPVSFLMTVFFPIVPEKETKPCFPAAVDGDLCFRYPFIQPFAQTFTDSGIALVMFNRTELAPDLPEAVRKGPLYEAYPECTFGALGAWAWGYSRCVDAMEQLGWFDRTHIAFTGHSRGGKTALLAGAVDERAFLVNPNDSGCCGAGCFRVQMAADNEEGKNCRNERLEDLCGRFPHWLGPEMAAYAGREAELPFDEHMLKALVAPRILLEGNAISDIWANPVGSWQTAMAAKQAFRLLGAEENHLWYWRTGIHFHHMEDLRHLVQVMQHALTGAPLPEDLFRLPFEAPEPIFSEENP